MFISYKSQNRRWYAQASQKEPIYGQGGWASSGMWGPQVTGAADPAGPKALPQVCLGTVRESGHSLGLMSSH